MDEEREVRRIREAIDETDDQILFLVERRLSLARAMAAAKPQGDEHSPLRPNREATILERLKRSAQLASAQLIDILWRELIGQGRQAQGPMRLVLFTHGDTLLLEECARRHFSSAIPVEWAESRQAALEAVRRRPAIAVTDIASHDDDLISLGEIRSSVGVLVGHAYARATAESSIL
jgi:chorismate mutase